jgi:hypothetical protein
VSCVECRVVNVATNLGGLKQNELTLAGRHVAIEACRAAEKGVTWNHIDGSAGGVAKYECDSMEASIWADVPGVQGAPCMRSSHL